MQTSEREQVIRMKMWMIRHAETEYNKQRRYQGRLDLPISEKGRRSLAPSGEPVSRVYVSTLRRTAQTARILFPEAQLIEVPGLEEMDFGRFDGHTSEELESDPAYQEWIDSWCTTAIPGGESRQQFSERIVRAMTKLIEQAASAGEEKLVIVAHGGTIMSALETLGRPAREYYEWLPGNAEGYELEIPLPLTDPPLCHVVRNLSFCNATE